MELVVFNRNFRKLQGGHLKVFHYFQHVRSSASFDARIRFAPGSAWDQSNPWFSLPETVMEPGEQLRADVLFLAGSDWRWLEPQQRAEPPAPVINLIQYLPGAQRDGPLNRFLAHPAVRICVSPQIQESLERSQLARGPIFTIPIGLDLERLPQAPAGERDLDCVVLALKDRPLGPQIAARLRSAGYSVLLVDEPIPRAELLAAMARARTTVHLPAHLEGAYLPALESMALGAAVVCPDCVGNRSFCRDGETCLMPKRTARAMTKAALTLLHASPEELEPMLAAGRREAAQRTLSSERARFLELLERVEELWPSC